MTDESRGSENATAPRPPMFTKDGPTSVGIVRHTGGSSKFNATPAVPRYRGSNDVRTQSSDKKADDLAAGQALRGSVEGDEIRDKRDNKSSPR